MTQWYYSDDARNRHGPHSAEELRRHYRERRIRRDTLVWREGLNEWRPLDQVAGELDLDSVVPDSSLPPPLPASDPTAPTYAARSAPPPKKGMSGCLIALLVCVGLAVPMIGILAAIALPAYQDYTVRAKVAATMAEAAPLKVAITDYISANDACPDNDSADIDTPLQQLGQGQYVASVRVGTLQAGNCAFEITLRSASTQVDGKTLLFETRREGASSEWDCSGGDLPARYRPMQCRAVQ
jgi:type IV pilus assembly protein PilA